MKRIGLVFFVLAMAVPSTVLAQSKADPLEGTLSQKVAKKDPFYGFGLRLGMRMGTGVNMEPEAAHLDMSYQFKVTWKFGKLITKKGWAKLLNLSLRLNLAHQPVGYSMLYRTGDVDPNYALASSETLPILDGGRFLSLSNEDVPRTVSGGGRTARVSDLMLSLAHGKLYMIPKAKIAFDGMVRVMLPTSLRSRTATLMFALTGALGASRTFKFKAGAQKQTLTTGYTFGFTKFFHEYKTAKVTYRTDDYVLDGVPVPSDLMIHNRTTTLNASYAWSNDFFVTYGFYKGMSLTVSYGLLSYRTYSFDNCIEEIQGLTVNLCSNNSELDPNGREPVGLRDYHGFSMSLSYAPVPYLGLQLAMSTQTPIRMPDSRKIYQPFFHTNRNGFTSIMLTAYLTMEKLYTTLTKKKKADAKAEKGKPSKPQASR